MELPEGSLRVLALLGLATSLRAQTPSQTAAWDALMLSPVGAFNPSSFSADPVAPVNTLAVRFGRWRYNNDDAAHEVYGATWSRAVGSRSRASVTAAYNFISCADCGGWAIGGVDFESTVARFTVNSAPRHGVWASLGLRGSAGGGKLRGDPGSTARSVAVEAPIDLSVRYSTNRDLSASLTPGLGCGRMKVSSTSDGSCRPTLGLTTAWNLNSPLRIEVGAHQVYINGGPIDLGVSLLWGFR